MDLSHATWRKSSRSGGQGNCVEVAALDGGVVAVRDSKNPTGPALIFTSCQWRAFIGSVNDTTHFDLPA